MITHLDSLATIREHVSEMTARCALVAHRAIPAADARIEVTDDGAVRFEWRAPTRVLWLDVYGDGTFAWALVRAECGAHCFEGSRDGERLDEPPPEFYARLRYVRSLLGGTP